MDRRDKIYRQGMLTIKQREMDALLTKIDRCVKDLTYYAYPYDGIESIEADKVLQAANELNELKTRWQTLSDEVKKIEAGI